jgi:hypothetical protein
MSELQSTIKKYVLGLFWGNGSTFLLHLDTMSI